MPAGPAGHFFPVSNKQVAAWSSATAYAKNDPVTYGGSSFVAINAVGPSATNPRSDTTNWLLTASGGGEIAYAENTAGYTFTASVTQTDVPGLSITIPAGTGPYKVLYDMPAVEFTFGASATTATIGNLRLALVDEGGLLLARGTWQQRAGAASDQPIIPIHRERRMAATASQKTIKVQCWLSATTNITNVTFFSGAGNSATPGIDPGPMFIQAVAL